MKRMVFGFLLVVLGVPEGLLAQQGPVATGMDVRLVISSDNDLRGTLVGWHADTLLVQDPASGLVQVVPSLDVKRLRVSEPRTRGRGALRGLLIGSIAGALSLGALAAADAANCTGFCIFSGTEAFLLGSAFGGAIGGGTGAAIGAAVPGTRWVDVATHP